VLDVGPLSLQLEAEAKPCIFPSFRHRLSQFVFSFLFVTDPHAVLASALHARTKDDTYNKISLSLVLEGLYR
jgi:hypothetical protein